MMPTLPNYKLNLLQAALTLCLVLGDSLNNAPHISNLSSRNLQSSGGLGECYIEYLGCVQVVLDPPPVTPAESLDILCSYLIEPGTASYITVVYPVDENGVCQLGTEGTAIDSSFIELVPPAGTAVDGLFDVLLQIDREGLAEAIETDELGELGYSFCIENNIIITDLLGVERNLGTHLTKVDVGVELDGNFQEITQIQLVANVVVDNFDIIETYTVSSYLCSAEEPHEALPENTVYELNDKLVLCVITNEGDTIIQSITEYELVQFDENGEIKHQFFHVLDGQTSTIANADCINVKPGSDVVQSMCVLEAKLTKSFFLQPDLGLTAVGVADLQLNPGLSSGSTVSSPAGGVILIPGARVLETGGIPISPDGHYNLKLDLNIDDGLFNTVSANISHGVCFLVLLISATLGVIV